MVEEKFCRICSGELESVLDLGDIYPSGFVKKDAVLSEDCKAPLVLAECKKCGLVQLKHTVDLDTMYRQYWYSSSLNKSMISSLKDIVHDVERKIELRDGDTVLDIGCNDGTLLELYPDNLIKVGYDPARNIERKSGYFFVNEYFTSDGYFDIYGQMKAKVITAIAMFYDLPDPNKFVKEVKSVLADDGIFVVQFTDLMSMFKATAFDNICHEHLEYYKLSDIYNLFDKHELDVVDVSYNTVNGGSIRVTACHRGKYNPTKEVTQSLNNEREYFADRDFGFFFDNIKYCLRQSKMFFDECKKYNKTVYLLGASTKGNTLLQVLRITNEDIPYAAEVNKDKFGLKTVGSGIEIISEDEAFNRKPDFLFVPIWHFKQSIIESPKIKSYLNDNGCLVFPLPAFNIVLNSEKEKE